MHLLIAHWGRSMHFVEHYLESPLTVLAEFTKVCLELIAVLCVLVGIVKAIQVLLSFRRKQNRRSLLTFTQLRLTFGLWLALALELQLGADIVATTVSPTFESLGKLGLIALIRTFLNFFLNKELAEQLKLTGLSRHTREESKSA